MILKMKYYSGRQVHNIITETIAGKTLADVLERFAKEPSADVQEIRHGKWEWNESIKTEDMDGWFIDEQGYVCSECGFIGVDNFNYCPSCGAKMTEE